MAGDFNVVLDNTLDRSSHSRAMVNPRMSSFIKQKMEQLGLCDIWWQRAGVQKGFTFYNKKYRHQSRINYFLIDSSVREWVQQVDHVGVHLSDHSAVILRLKIGERGTQSRWTLDCTILQDEGVMEILSKETEEFFKFNQGSSETGVIWDAYKAFLRGRLGALAAEKRRRYHKEVSSWKSRFAP